MGEPFGMSCGGGALNFLAQHRQAPPRSETRVRLTPFSAINDSLTEGPLRSKEMLIDPWGRRLIKIDKAREIFAIV
jgi:hypothetical protein